MRLSTLVYGHQLLPYQKRSLINKLVVIQYCSGKNTKGEKTSQAPNKQRKIDILLTIPT